MNKCCKERLKTLEKNFGSRKKLGGKIQKAPIKYFCCNICKTSHVIEDEVEDDQTDFFNGT